MSFPPLAAERPEESPAPATPPLDLAEARRRLEEARGPRFWRGLEELAEDRRFRELIAREFPRHASEWDESLDQGFSRRRFLELGLASLSLAGLTACTRQPLERIVPYVKQPEEVLPGVPSFYATATTHQGFAVGLLAESHEGRPTKLEGNPDHPASLGAATALAQASVLTLYDPDRSQGPTKLGDAETWGRFVEELRGAMKAQKALEGAGLRVLTETVTSPTLAAQMKALLEAYPKAKWVAWEPAGRDAARAGALLAFGEAVETRYDLSAADVVVSLDADFLASGPFSLRYARDFMRRRRLEKGAKEMNRLYVLEASPSPTGTVADHRVPVRASALPSVALALGAELGIPGFTRPAALDAKLAGAVAAAARDLKAAAGRGAVIPGDTAPPEVHAAAHAINAALGNTGRTVIHTDPVEASPGPQGPALAELVEEIRQKKVDVLLILGGNPVYDAPPELKVGEALLSVPFRAHLGLHADETAEYCPWHVPMAHFLETWGDARALDGTASIVQPLVEPLYDGKSAQEVLSALLDETPRKGYDLVRDRWKGALPPAEAEAAWRKALHDGVVAGTALPARDVRADGAAVAAALATAAARAPKPGTLELALRPDPSVFDGRFANNGWLQELPRPLSKLTWDNAAVLSPRTAERLGVTNEDVVTVGAGGRKLDLPVLVQPGQAEDVLTVHLGYGRTRAGRVGNGVGASAYALRPSGQTWLVPGATVERTGRRHRLAHTQQHFRMEGREIVRVARLERYQKEPDFARKLGDLPPKEASLYPGFEYKLNAWGLSVDLNACIGCNACVVACQSENNIPVVGPEQVSKNREMHWIRIDQYYEGTDPDDPEIHHQPVMCQHCENAPCEVVCPVTATAHSAEGLNDMVYNRCVGTRYCSNNCPYKVRRFNFLEYNGSPEPVLKMLRNPDVTVRSRGVMEKCTLCVQRINRARIAAEREGRAVRDGEIRTACQQTCPAEAIVFGNVNDPAARVTALKADPRTYWLLDELNTRPRISYQAKVKNPSPDVEAV